MVFQDVIIGVFVGVVMGAMVAAIAFVRHCKNTPSTDED